jgi:hypothetical protein
LRKPSRQRTSQVVAACERPTRAADR